MLVAFLIGIYDKQKALDSCPALLVMRILGLVNYSMIIG